MHVMKYKDLNPLNSLFFGSFLHLHINIASFWCIMSKKIFIFRLFSHERRKQNDENDMIDRMRRLKVKRLIKIEGHEGRL